MGALGAAARGKLGAAAAARQPQQRSNSATLPPATLLRCCNSSASLHRRSASVRRLANLSPSLALSLPLSLVLCTYQLRDFSKTYSFKNLTHADAC